ncbi:hypothetical protein ONS95_011692 [Cadophora gregata]|uniref:uncharacterized protein n=1 Tax=Cadophora gregata TaxID=51156 RepID=UPI0026DACE0C|nr:uncharacterized protein ONS95_011692 [Cadophora gregata]KAK0120286.1 hypothetical protein ONS95_011692 [Cadophora gregata]KAK0121318.1 hypothetical protein ONS96_011494 [Cadophora gregata f. sp. sojae]
MVLIVLTLLAGKALYDDHKERKMRKAEMAGATSKALRSKQQVNPLPSITITPDASPVYIANEQGFGPPAYQKDASSASSLTSESLVSLETVDTLPIPEKNPARFALD